MKDLLKSKLGNYEEIDLYFKLIHKNKDTEYISGKTEAHHILPRSIFPEYENFVKHPWNKVNLSYYDHFIAHYYLAISNNASMIYAFNMLNNFSTGRFSEDVLAQAAEKYSSLKEVFSNYIGKVLKEANQGKTTVRNILTGEVKRADSSVLGPEWVGISKGSSYSEATKKSQSESSKKSWKKPEHREARCSAISKVQRKSIQWANAIEYYKIWESEGCPGCKKFAKILDSYNKPYINSLQRLVDYFRKCQTGYDTLKNWR